MLTHEIFKRRESGSRDERKGISQSRRRSRIAPLAVDGSTTRPPCMISSFPAATRRRAARRLSSIRSRQPSGKACLAASLGQIVEPAARRARSVRITSSSACSLEFGFCLRQASEQYFTSFQQRSHFRRHSMRRPQVLHVFSSGITHRTLARSNSHARAVIGNPMRRNRQVDPNQSC
jgi:hypothetical protein